MATLTKWDRKKQCPGDKMDITKADVKEVIPRNNTCANGTYQAGAKVILSNKQEIPVVETVSEVKKALGLSQPARSMPSAPELVTN